MSGRLYAYLIEFLLLTRINVFFSDFLRFLLKFPGQAADKGGRLPPSPTCHRGNCYPTMPLTTGDTAYLNGVEKDLNAMLASEATANGVTFVEAFTPSIGHDAGTSTSVRWVNPIIATDGGISVHPDPTGETEMALFVESALAG